MNIYITVTRSTANRNMFMSVILVIINYGIVTGQLDPPRYDHGLGIPTTKPLNIAHRGSMGTYPEHTIPSYLQAMEMGTDMIEVDIAVTRDLHLICVHETYLSAMTNIGSIFPADRMNTYEIDGANRTDYFSVDFTLEELKQVKMKQRYDFRDPNYDYQSELTSFEELIQIVQGANRTVALLPELKDTAWANSLDIIKNGNTTFEDLMVNLLNSYGYVDDGDSVVVESFELASVQYVSQISQLAVSYVTRDPLTDDQLQDLAQFCYRIVVEKGQVIEVNGQGQRVGVTDLVERARSFGLRIHVWTMRNEDEYLVWTYEQDPYLEYEDFVMNGLVDGILTDFPSTFNRYLNVLYDESYNYE